MTSHYTNQGALLIRNSDIKDSRFEFGDNPIYLDDEFAKQNASRKHRVGDVITVHTGDIGTSAVITDKEVGSIGFATIVTRPDMKKIISEYLCAYLNTDTHKNFALNISTGDGRNNYNLKDYYECVVPVPNIAEQRKISRFIDEMNHLITLHQRKCDETKKLKKFMLQKMFPKNGEKNPEIRFAGFTDDWEQRKLGEVLKERSERANGDEELLSVTISSGVIRQAYSDKINTASEDKSNYKIVCKGDVPYNSMRMWQGAVGYSRYDGIVSPAYTVLIPTEEANGKFFMELFKKETTLQIFKRWSQGLTSDTWNLKYPTLSVIQFPIPSIEEQTKLAEYFHSLDHLITLHQRKCDKLKLIKKFMLQNMFPKKG